MLADYVVSLGRGRSVVEVGTRNGDLSACIANFTRRYTAIEMEEGYCHSLRTRGLTAVCKDFNLINLETELPPIDVIMWFVWPPEISEAWLRKLWRWRKRTRKRLEHERADRVRYAYP